MRTFALAATAQECTISGIGAGVLSNCNTTASYAAGTLCKFSCDTANLYVQDPTKTSNGDFSCNATADDGWWGAVGKGNGFTYTATNVMNTGPKVQLMSQGFVVVSDVTIDAVRIAFGGSAFAGMYAYSVSRYDCPTSLFFWLHSP